MKNGCGGATAPGGGGGTTTRYLPKEVVFAVKLAFSRKAFLCQIAFTFTALNTLHMPSPVQYIQQKPVQDWPFAACTVNHCLWLFLRAGGSGFPDVKQKKKRKKKLRIKKNNKKFSKRRQHRRRFAFLCVCFKSLGEVKEEKKEGRTKKSSFECPRRDTQEKPPTARGDQRFDTTAESRPLPTTTATMIIIRVTIKQQRL